VDSQTIGGITMTTNTIGLDDSGNLDLDHLYKVLLGRGPDAYQGGLTDAEKGITQDARDYWNNQFTAAGSNEAALQSVVAGIQGSDEYKGLWEYTDEDGNTYLDKDTYLTNSTAAQNKVQAAKSIARGDGVRRGSVASFSDKYNPDGTVRDDWVSIEEWNKNYIESLQDENENLINNPTIQTVTEYVDRWHQADTSAYDQTIADLQNTITGMTSDYADLEDLYNTAQTGYDSLYAAAAYGERPRNMTVRGVRTQNELPGYTPRTTGTGFFSRNRGVGSGLTTGSLNLA
tara:strand:- start:143 stop:1006 length:864 start_codon:yes stop_codon:yes gene_type:complete